MCAKQWHWAASRGGGLPQYHMWVHVCMLTWPITRLPLSHFVGMLKLPVSNVGMSRLPLSTCIHVELPVTRCMHFQIAWVMYTLEVNDSWTLVEWLFRRSVGIPPAGLVAIGADLEMGICSGFPSFMLFYWFCCVASCNFPAVETSRPD